MTKLVAFAKKAGTAWFHWVSFKLGFFVGGIVCMIYMAVLLTVPSVAENVLGMLR